MIRPLLPVLWGIIGGILLEHFWKILHCTDIFYAQYCARWPGLLIYGLVIGIWYVCYRFKYARLATISLVLLATLIGMTRYAASRHLPVHHISHFIEDERVTIEGILYKPPEFTPNFSYEGVGRKQYLYLETTWLEQGDRRYRVCGKIRITLTEQRIPLASTKIFTYGDVLRMRLRLHVPRNFKQFNYREFLHRQGIYLLGTLQHDRYIIKLPGHQGHPFLTGIYALRRRMIHVLDLYASNRSDNTPEAIQIIKALTLGTSRELSPEIKEAFRRAGMYHFLVVSGIHIGILSWVLHQLLHVCSVPLQYRSLMLASVLLVYAGMTGFQFPVLRAVIMALTFYFSSTWNRHPDSLYSLAFAVCVLLMAFPASCFEISFQMTVAATMSILMVFRHLKPQTHLPRFIQTSWILRSSILALLATCGAMLGVAPLLLYYFGNLSIFSFITNPVAVFLVSPLLSSGLFANFLALLLSGWEIMSPLLTIIMSFNTFLANYLLAFASLFPELQFPVPPLSSGIIVGYYILLYLLFVVGYYRTSRTCPTVSDILEQEY